MAKRIPDGIEALTPATAGSGMPAVQRIDRALALNGNYLYAAKGTCGGSAAAAWNEKHEQFVAASTSVTGAASHRIHLGTMRVPIPLAAGTDVEIATSFFGTPGAGKLRLESSDGSVVEAECSVDAVTVRLHPADWDIYLVSGDALGTLTVRGICAWSKRREFAGKATDFLALKQSALAAMKPNDAYVYQRLIRNQADVLCEPGSVFFSRWYGVPWSNSNKGTVLGQYRFITERTVSELEVWLYARCHTAPSGSGQIITRLDGVAVGTHGIAYGDGWRWIGPINASIFPGPGIRELSIDALMTSGTGEGTGVEVAAVCAWEKPSTLTLPVGDSAPLSYGGNDADVFAGVGVPAVADLSGAIPMGTAGINRDAIWLKRNCRRLLVCDWRHRTGRVPDIDRWYPGVAGSQVTYDGQVPMQIAWETPPGAVPYPAGSVLARLKIPPTAQQEVDVRLQLRFGDFGSASEQWEVRVAGHTWANAETLIFANDASSNPLPFWTAPLRVDRNPSGPTELLIEARCVTPPSQPNGLHLWGFAIDDVPLAGSV